MKKKGYRGQRCIKRTLSKCEGQCRTFDDIQYAYATLLSEMDEIESFRTNVLLEGFKEGEYTTDFVANKTNGNLMVRECVYKKHLLKPMTCRLLDASYAYWLARGVADWGIVVEKGAD